MKKNNKIIIACLLIFSIGFISSITIYSGESYELILDQPYEYYSIIGNLTEVNILVTQEDNVVTITPYKYTESNNFEIVFFDSEKEIIEIHHSSSSSTRWKTEYVDRNITKYLDKEVIIPGETIEKEGETIEIEKIPLFIWIIIVVLLIIIIILVVYLIKSNTNYLEEDSKTDLIDIDERGYEQNE